MKRVVVRTNRAQRDLLGLSLYFERVAGLATALRFLDETERAFDQLSIQPELGGVWSSEHHQLIDVRV